MHDESVFYENPCVIHDESVFYEKPYVIPYANQHDGDDGSK
jgi:hypothetical protein